MPARHTIVLLFIFLICLLPASAAATPKAGDMAIDFHLKEIDGGEKKYSLSDFKGKLILLNIWASWCGGCKEEMPHFIDLQQQFKKDDFLIVAASVDRRVEDTTKFLGKLENKSGKKVNFLVLIDEEKTIAKDYNPFGMPASYLIDGEGKIIKSFYGAIKGSAMKGLKAEIETLLKEQQ